jgi:hypothetical protein
MVDVRSWIERATAMTSMTDKHALLSELAAVEDGFEILELGPARGAASHLDVAGRSQALVE